MQLKRKASKAFLTGGEGFVRACSFFYLISYTFFINSACALHLFIIFVHDIHLKMSIKCFS
jgi:hypothetical protein